MSLPASAPPSLRDIDWRWALPRILVAFLLTRLLVLAVAVAVEATQPPPPDGIRADERPILASLTAWDGVYYLDIAGDGYRAEADPFPSYAFFPGYPLLVRAVSLLTFGDSGLAAVVAANAALLLALVALYALSVRHLPPERAIWSLWFLLLAPGAVSLSMSYTEGLFLLCAVGAFLAAEIRRPWAAGILLAMAAITRVPGILLLVPILVLYVSRDGPRPTRDWLPLLLAPASLAIFFLYAWWLTGDPLAPIHAQDYWGPSDAGAEGVAAAAPGEADGATMGMGQASSLILALWIATIAFYAFLFVYFRPDRIGPAYWIVGILAIVGIFASGRLQSAPRYLAMAWPFDWVLANRGSRVGRAAVLAIFALLQTVLLWWAFTWQVPP